MSTEPNANESDAVPISDQNRVTKAAIIRFILMILIVPAALFLTAGRADWFMGWVYIGLVIVFSAGSRFIVLRKDPDLLAERAQSLSKEDAKPWDKWIVLQIAMVGPIVMLAVCGLDERFGWSPDMPPVYVMSALAVIVLGYGLSTWAMIENRFFSGVVRIQKDRGHHAVTTGPYRLLRHPSYLGGICSFLAIPILLGSLWALIAGAYLSAVMILRTALEDRTLQEELEGYEEYARKVRFRLVPGIW